LPPAYGPPITAAVTAPPKSDKVAYGAYLAGPLGHCIECHSSPGANGAPDFVNHLGAGGMNFNGPWGTTLARNITPTNLGTWLDSDIKTAITTGVRPGGERLRPPMAYGYYKNINGDDLDAIIAYRSPPLRGLMRLSTLRRVVHGFGSSSASQGYARHCAPGAGQPLQCEIGRRRCA
jgi:mono/diheme cytochrome c family protein